MTLPPDPSTSLGERRRSARQESASRLTVTLETPAFGGRAENVSEAGVFFFSGDRLRVRVEVDDDGRVATRPGWLVRVERMSEDSTGYAIEFDHG